MLITKNTILNFHKKLPMIKSFGLNMWLSGRMLVCVQVLGSVPASQKQNEKIRNPNRINIHLKPSMPEHTCNLSPRKLKQDIKSSVASLDYILTLEPVTSKTQLKPKH